MKSLGETESTSMEDFVRATRCAGCCLAPGLGEAVPPMGMGVGMGGGPFILVSGLVGAVGAGAEEAPSSFKGTVGGMLIPTSPSRSTRCPSSLWRSVASALPNLISRLPIVFFDWSWSASNFPWLRTALSSAIPPSPVFILLVVSA